MFIPKDVIRLIAKKCDLKTQVRCRLLNKYWYSALDDIYLSPLKFVIADFDEITGNETIYGIYDVNQDEYYEYDVETKIECLDNLSINSFEITDIKEIYFCVFTGHHQYFLGKTKDSYFLLDEEFSPSWTDRYLYFSNSLTKLVKSEMTKHCKEHFFAFLDGINNKN